MFDVLKKGAWLAADSAHAPNWHRVRRPELGREMALTGTTRHWLQRLPARRRPYRLCLRFPRVANRIAWSWADVAMTGQVLDDLLVDRRGGRAGFPPWVFRELRRLQEFNQQQRQELKPESLREAAERYLGVS